MNVNAKSICWRCKNFSSCSWSRGVPVKDWDATPTIIDSQAGGVQSYLVKGCPQYNEDDLYEISPREIYERFGISCNRDRLEKTNAELEKFGYKLLSKGGLYIARLDNANKE